MSRKTIILTAAGILAAAVSIVSCVTIADMHSRSYKMISQKESHKFLDADLKYPQFAGPRELNAAVEKEVLSPYLEFRKSAEKNWKDTDSIRKETGATDSTPPFEYTAVCDPVFSDSRYASFLITTYVFEGGAHGDTEIASCTYDRKQKKFLSVTDVSGMTAEQLSSRCRETLKKTLVYGGTDNDSEKNRISWIEEGTVPELEKFSNFTLNGKSLTIYFPEYEVGPHSCGIPKVTIQLTK